MRNPRWFALLLLVAPIAGLCATACEPSAQLLKNPYVPRVGKCIFSLKRTIAEPESRKFAEKLIHRALTDTEHENKGPGDPLNFYELAELAALLNTLSATDAMLDFIVPGSADETWSSAVARLYELRAPLVFARMALRPEPDRKRLIASIAWGLANNFYLFMTRDNFARLAVGANWEVTEPTHPHRELSKAIESALLDVLSRS